MSENVLRFNFLARDQASSTFEKIGKESDGLQSKIGKFGKFAGTALLGVGTAFAGLGVAGVTMGVKTAAAMEQAQVGFTTLLGSGQKAQTFLTNLKKFAASTPFELPGLVSSSRLLIGVGTSATDTMKTLQAFGDAASAVGVGQDAFQRIMLATSQAISAGKFQAGDLNQITEAGIPIWKILAESMHKPVPEIKKLSSEGKLLANDVLPLLNKQMEKDYGGSMAKQSQTLNGLWSTFMDTLNLGLANAIQPMIPALKTGLAGATGVAAKALKGIPGVIDTVTSKFKTVKNIVNKDVRPALENIFKGVKAKLPKIDISGVGKTFIKESSKWSGDIITGIKTGFKTGDWSSLGNTLGDGLSKALVASATGASKLGVAVGKWIGGIDWFSVGEDVGQQAFPFIIGFSNTLVQGLFDVAKAHPLDTALFIISLIPIGKLAAAFGPLRTMIEHLPFGEWFTGLLDKTAVRVYDGIAGFVKGFFKTMLKGFTDEFPGLSGFIGRGLRNISDTIGLHAMYAAEKAGEFVDGVATGMGRRMANVVKAGERLVKIITSPFANAGRWLVSKGKDVVDGLVQGAVSFFSRVITTQIRLVKLVTSPFAKAGSWLIGKGREVVSGVISGIGDRFGALGTQIVRTISKIRTPFNKARGWLLQAGRQVVAGIFDGMVNAAADAGRFAANVGGKIVRAVKGYFGIKSPSKVMMGIGGNLISSVFKAMVDHNPVPIMGKIFGGMPQALGALAEKGLVSLKNLPSKALNALSGLGGSIGKKVAGLLGLGGGAKLSGGLSAAEKWIIMHESGGRTTAQNPTSTAFGLGQLLIANRKHYGAILGVSPNTTNYNDQLKMFRMYVADRYGNAANAQKFWEAHHYYDEGGEATGSGFMAKRTKQPERVLSPRQTEAFNQLVKVIDRNQGMGASSPAGADIDYRRMGDHVAAAFIRAGVSVTMDGKELGKIIGKNASLLGRTG
jgi:tape measure domain-containing protein